MGEESETACEHCKKEIPLICEPFCDACYFGVKHDPSCDCRDADEYPDVEYVTTRPMTKDEFFWGF